MILVRKIKGVKPLKFKIVKNDNNRRDKIIFKQLKESKLI